LNVRDVLRWELLGNGKIRFGVDSAMSGLGAALFAEINQDMTLNSYKFSMKNCLGIDRWHIEEMVYKVDNMGQVSSTMEAHDINNNRVAYFFRYAIKRSDGVLVATSTLYRMGAKQVNFTEYKNGMDTGKVLAIATKRGQWENKGWHECMSPTSPRAWDLYFPVDRVLPGFKANGTSGPSQASMATVQDIRVALTGAITLMAHRDEVRGKDGISTEGSNRQMTMFAGGIALIVLTCLLAVNFCMVFKASGLRDKLKKTLFDSEGAFLPKTPSQQRAPVFNPTY